MPIITSPVRKAGHQDETEIMEICRQNHSENGQFSLSLPKVQTMVGRAFNDGGAVIGAVGKVGQPIEGIIMLLITQFWYTSDWCLDEVLNYVRPEYRKSTNAKDMISFGKRCSDELGIPLVIGVFSNERTKAKMELYKRQLGEPIGGYFLHRPASVGFQSA